MNDAVKIIKKVTESHDTVTFKFQWNKKCKPGQFVMIWIPGCDEIPMSLSSVGDVKSVTVKAIGEATKKIHELSAGDTMFVRGPYGNGFKVTGKKILVVAGGVGTAAMMPLIRETKADVIMGARNSSELIFEKEISKYSELLVSTDDGSKGFHGNAVQLAKEQFSKGYDMIMGCGPEIMLYYLHKACIEENIKCQLSLERYMKCGAGVCGACMLDEHRVCKDGPIFNEKQISGMKEFGRSKRDSSGILIKL